MRMPERTYRERLKANTLLAARKIVTNEGLGALQARRIAQDSGCSVGTIYNLYDGLDDLIINVNAATLDDLGANLRAEKERSAATGLEERLTGLALAYLAFALDSQTSWRALFEHQLAKDRTIPDWYRERQAGLFGIVEDILRPAVPEESQRQMAARALFSAVHGIVSLALDQKLGEFDRDATEAQVRFIVDAAARGLNSVSQADPPGSSPTPPDGIADASCDQQSSP
jgi:AcrR family transcriptional regulator